MGSEYFVGVAVTLAMILLVWNCFEVGRNDAANLVNAVFGSRVMRRKRAVIISGVVVILGATFSSPVMDTVRKGIFDPGMLDATRVIALFLSANLVGTVLLYSYSAFGMPVSTTATLVFALAGGAIGASGTIEIVNWPTFQKVLLAIVLSVFLSALAGFMIQRMFRGAIREDGEDHKILLLHGPWVTGFILTSLTWFMVIKGLKGIPLVKAFRAELVDNYGTIPVLFVYWGFLTLLVHLLLTIIPRRKAVYLFRYTAIFGMCCLSFAFGQNDLANAASPGLASYFIWQGGMTGEVDIPMFALFACGFLIFLGMTTKKAQRVTRAEVNVASQYDSVNLYAPKWTMALAKLFISKNGNGSTRLAPAPALNERNKKLHYDPLRASVIMAVSASVIAFASGMGIPVSTTYVGFAAVMATGWGDRVFHGGDSSKKVGRAIWVVFCWFLGGAIAAVACGLTTFMIIEWQLLGIALAVCANLYCRWYFHTRSEAHEAAYHGKGAHSSSD